MGAWVNESVGEWVGFVYFNVTFNIHNSFVHSNVTFNIHNPSFYILALSPLSTQGDAKIFGDRARHDE